MFSPPASYSRRPWRSRSVDNFCRRPSCPMSRPEKTLFLGTVCTVRNNLRAQNISRAEHRSVSSTIFGIGSPHNALPFPHAPEENFCLPHRRDREHTATQGDRARVSHIFSYIPCSIRQTVRPSCGNGQIHAVPKYPSPFPFRQPLKFPSPRSTEKDMRSRATETKTNAEILPIASYRTAGDCLQRSFASRP